MPATAVTCRVKNNMAMACAASSPAATRKLIRLPDDAPDTAAPRNELPIAPNRPNANAEPIPIDLKAVGYALAAIANIEEVTATTKTPRMNSVATAMSALVAANFGPVPANTATNAALTQK